MSVARPVLMIDALVALYLLDASGGALLDAPVWIGRCQEALEWEEEFPASDATPTGAPTRQMHREPAAHRITLERTWMMRLDGEDWRPHRSDAYLLSVTWYDQLTRRWLQRLYWHAQTLSRRQHTAGPLQLMESNTFRARSVTDQCGEGSQLLEPTGAMQSILSVQDTPWRNGDTLHGVYRWRNQVRVKSARLHATAAAEVRMMVGNSPAGVTLSSGGVTSWSGDIVVPGDQQVSWQVVSATPGATHGAVVATILPEVTGAVPASQSALELNLIAWTESEAFSRLISRYDMETNILESATCVWPDGTPGELTVTATDSEFSAVDAFEITYVRPAPLVSYRVTQGEVERNAYGDVTTKPQPTVAVLA